MAIEGFAGTLEEQIYESDLARWGRAYADAQKVARDADQARFKADGDRMEREIRARWASYGWTGGREGQSAPGGPVTMG